MSEHSTPTPARPLRVVMLVESVYGGGAERFTVGLSRALSARGEHVVVCASRGAGRNREPIAHETGVDVLMLGRTRMVSPVAWARLVRYLRRHRVDVLHSHMYGSNVWAPILGRLGGVPVVVATEHSWTYEGQRIRKLLDRFWVGRGVDAFVAVSPEDARRMAEIEKVPAGKIRMIPTGLLRDPDDLASAPATVRDELGLGRGVPVVGAVGHLRPMKAIDVLVDAFARVLERVPDAHLIIAGDGPLRPDIEAQIAALGVGARVHLLGVREDVPAVLASSDVVAMPSDSEGSPIALIEAMTAGRAVVATRVGGVPAILDEGRCGVLVPPRDPAALADAVESLLADPQRAARLGRVAATRARGEYGIAHIAGRWSDLYRELYSTVGGGRQRGNR
ncbi:MAG: glycosyltransferase [Thermoleophilia bacterium]|nr:glycosyltransferase [Thermoleophilia bacterium]